MSTKKTFESFVNSVNENADSYKIYKKVSGKYSLRKPSYWGDLFNSSASIPYKELRKFDKELNSLDVYTTRELGCHSEYPMQANFKVQVPQVFVLYCNTEGGELGEFYGMSILVNTEGATYPRYACGMPDFEPELHNFANGIPESYLDIVTTGAQLLYESIDKTSDEDRQHYDFLLTLRDSGKTNMFGAAPYLQKEFGMSKKEAREVLSKWMKRFNEGKLTEAKRAGLSKKETLKVAQKFADALTKLDGKKYTVSSDYEEDSFDLDIDGDEYAGGSYNINDDGSVVNMATWNRKTNVSPTYGNMDDDIKTIIKTIKNIKESSVTEATVIMDAIDPKSNVLKKLLKKHNVKMKVLTMNGPGGGHPEVEMTGSREDLQAVLADPNGWDDADLGEYIEESNILEARSINKISKEFGETVGKMKDIVKIYIAAADGSDEKATTRQQLIDLTQKKKALVKELDDAVAGKNKDVKLVISEGVMSDIHQMIGNHKSFDTFQKEFFKEYGHKKVMKKTPEFLEWLKALYNDFEYAVEEKYTKKSLLKKLGDADDAMIQTGNGKEYIIYNPDSNNDDNAAMWHDKSVFAVDQDGEEHEISYKDIGLVMVESIVTENSVTFTLDDGDLDDKFLSDKSLSRNLDYKEDGRDTYYVLPKRDFDRLQDWADSSGYDTDEVIEVIEESVITEANGQTVKEFGDLLALLLDEDSGLDIERAIIAMAPNKARVLEKQISTLYKKLFDLTNQGFDLREVTESKIQIKRRYTDNHPAQTSGRKATVRNAMIEALADSVLTEEEFNNILKEKSIDNKRWMRRNSKYFKVSEGGITLSKFGKRILTGIKPVVNLTLESFITEKANISGAYNDLENLLGTDMETMDDFQRIENDGTWEEMSDFIEMAGDAEVLRRHKFKSQKDIDKLAKYVMGESVVNEANYIKFKGKKVDISSLEMEDVDMKDYPDFSDAYFSYGEYSNGKEMTDEELSDFTDDNLDLANELAHDSLH